MVAPDFDIGGIQPDIWPIALYGPSQKCLHACVDLAAQARDLAFADPLHAQRLDQIIDRTGRYALDIGLLDDRGQCLLGHPSGLQEAGEVAAVAQLGYAQLDGSGTRLPVAIAIAVALVEL